MPTFLTYSTPRIAKTLPVTLAVLVFCQVQRANAQIVTDGTMGRAGALTGPNYDIGAELGKLYGSNLFHSFSEFNLQNGQSANFSGPASVRNILSRVTGGSPSSIDGSINSSIKGANLFFINPSGVIFGAHAQVNVSGSFVASTANVLKLADGSVFSATDPGNSVLSSASPAAFGFLNANPAAITLNGAQLKVGAGKTLSLVGGDLQLNGASLGAEKGAINLVSVGSPGEVAFDAANPATLTGFNKLGAITMDGATVDVGDNTGGSGAGGNVTVRGGSLTMTNASAIQTKNQGKTEGGLLDIEVGGRLELTGNSTISSTASGSGTGASIRLKAGDISMEGPGFFDPVDFTGVRASAARGSSGGAGNMNVETGGLELKNGARIGANTEGSGPGGNITIHADHILLDGQNSPLFTGLAAQVLSTASGHGGNIDIQTGSLQVLGGAEVSTSTVGAGDGGAITIHANDIVLDGGGTDFFNGIAASTSSFFNGGKGGNINLFTDALHMKNGGQISVSTRGSGAGGAININAKSLDISNKGLITAEVDGIGPGGSINIDADDIVLDGNGQTENTGILASTFSGAESGKAGSITIRAKNLQLVHGGRIVASTAQGSGPGGNIDITANDVLLDGQNDFAFTAILAQSVDSNPEAKGGSITMHVGRLRLRGGAEISAATNSRGDGGDITIDADQIVMNGANQNFASLISASTGSLGRGGQGGTITIRVKDLQLRGSSGITTNTRGTGEGGSITLEAGKILMDGDGTQIKSQSTGFDNTGNGGDIDVTADDLDMRNGGTITATTTGQGRGGTIEVKAGTLSLRTGASINAGTSGTGQGGDITVQGDSILLDGAGSSDLTGIAAQTEGRGVRGNGGSVTVNAGTLEITNGGTVSTTTLGVGQGGNITVNADTLDLNRNGSIQSSSRPIEPVANNNNGGGGGDILLRTGTLKISSGASVAANALAGGGKGGSVTIQSTGAVQVESGGSITAAAATDDAGDISIESGDAIEVRDGQITTSAGKNGGNIDLKAARLIYLRNSLLSAVANGNGGNITIDPEAVVFDRSQVRADAINGNGGNILIRSRVFLPSIESIISASSQFGVAGNIAIESPNTNVGGSLIRLPDNPLDAESFLPERCVVRQTGQSSSFTVNTRRGAPPLPDDLSPSVAVK